MNPDVSRATRRAAFAKQLRRLLVEHDVEQSHLAALLGVSPQERKSLPAFDVEALPPVVLDALLATWADQRGLVLAPAPDTSATIGDDYRHHATLTRLLGELEALNADALADGRYTGQEAERIERAARDAIAAVAALRARVEPVQVSRLDGARRATR